jgi:hypothetical protein
LSHARPYDFCKGTFKQRHTGTPGSGRSSRSIEVASFEFPPRRKLAPAVRKKRAARRWPVRRPTPPSWGGENDMQAEETSKGCLVFFHIPEGALSRFVFGAAREASSVARQVNVVQSPSLLSSSTSCRRCGIRCRAEVSARLVDGVGDESPSPPLTRTNRRLSTLRHPAKDDGCSTTKVLSTAWFDVHGARAFCVHQTVLRPRRSLG